jgi:hypothetical protein
MVRSAITCICLFAASQAQAFSGNFTSGLSHNEVRGETKYNLGLMMYQSLPLGIDWWSWSGACMTQKNSENPDRWVQTLHGLNFTINNVVLTGTMKALFDIEEKQPSAEYGARIKVKLW